MILTYLKRMAMNMDMDIDSNVQIHVGLIQL
jgi:hypothetical protein